MGSRVLISGTDRRGVIKFVGKTHLNTDIIMYGVKFDSSLFYGFNHYTPTNEYILSANKYCDVSLGYGKLTLRDEI